MKKKVLSIIAALIIVCTTTGISHSDEFKNYSGVPKEVYYKFIKDQNRRLSQKRIEDIYKAVEYFNPRYFGTKNDDGIIWTLSVMAQESSFRNVNGDEGLSIGYMQVQIPTCDVARRHNGIKRQLNLHSLWDNVHCGMGEINRLHKKFGNFDLAIMAYNCGASCVDFWIRKGLVAVKKRNYFDKVNGRRRHLLEIIDANWVKEEKPASIVEIIQTHMDRSRGYYE